MKIRDLQAANVNVVLRNYNLGDQHFSLFVPDAEQIAQYYQEQQRVNTGVLFPYWAKVWPAAIALSEFICLHPEYIIEKNVLELAAGLGLPSIVAAGNAATVICSDFIAEPLNFVEQTVRYNGLSNLHCRIVNWRFLPNNLSADVLLLSDINYDPVEFDHLYSVLGEFISSGTTILLSTPQRLIAKVFIDRILPWCTICHEILVKENKISTMISIFVLKAS